jgi:hypothetical protein
MKTFAAFTTVALLVTSPISALAQTSPYDICVGRCEEVYGNRQGQCVERYGGSVEGEYCILGAGQERDGCLQSCNSEFPSLTGFNPQEHRFRPTEIAEPHQPA